MSEIKVSTESASINRSNKISRPWYRKKLWLGVIVLAVISISLASWQLLNASSAPVDPPEAAKILEAQESLQRFGILIPAYLPKSFDRSNPGIKISNNGLNRDPAVELTYFAGKDDAVFLRQWIPVNPKLEVLSGSRPIETQWGKGWLLTQGDTLATVWVDIGQLRVAITTNNLQTVSREQLVLIANTLGLASVQQAYSFTTKFPEIKDVVPPPPFEVQINDQGIQEFNLIITPGGYTPLRFAVKKEIPVKMNFSALGEVGCGNTLLFPLESGNMSALTLSKEKPRQVIEFTPRITGDFPFYCTNNCFRGIMTVRE